MKRVIAAVLAFGLVAVSVAISRDKPLPGISGFLQITSESRNPWTHLRLNNDPQDFQFVVVSDRTGGHREKVFSRAVEQINLLQPEFVLSVGDLIEGYTTDTEKVASEWREFQGFVNRFEMPFFYVAGNHDVTNPTQEKIWQEKFGRRWYHFVYKGALFLVLCSEDPSGKGMGFISDAQLADVKKILEENANPRWTFVALHKPLWAAPDLDKNGWLDVEKLLAGRPYTVFAGHVHRYQKFTRQGMNYYQLATTGGISRLRGTRYGEFDHVMWVTMKKDAPILANIMLDGVLPENLRMPETTEPVVMLERKAVHPVKGMVYVDGCPAAGATVFFWPPIEPGRRTPPPAEGLIEADGSFLLTTYSAYDGAPAGEYTVTVQAVKRSPLADDLGKPVEIPAAYQKRESTPLKATVKAGPNEFTFELKSE